MGEIKEKIKKKIKIIRPETEVFISFYNKFNKKKWKGNAELARELGYNNAASITEITKGRQNIDFEKYKIFKEKYLKIEGDTHLSKQGDYKHSEGTMVDKLSQPDFEGWHIEDKSKRVTGSDLKDKMIKNLLGQVDELKDQVNDLKGQINKLKEKK